MNYIPDPLIIDYYGCSDIGMVRIENQDYLGKYPKDNLDLYTEKGQLFIVADGMGGHAGGRLASTTAVETIIRYFVQTFNSDAEAILTEAIAEGNKIVYEKAKESEDYKKMGTTCVVLLLKENTASIGHVGDSRIYLIENGRIEQLTTDHTQVQEMLKRGILTKEEAAKHPGRSILAKALGVDPNVEPDIKSGINLRKGQIFVLCTDGLSKVSAEEILNISSSNSPKVACDKLIALANNRGGKDNVTVQIIRIDQRDQLNSKINKEKKSHFLLYLSLLVIAAGILLFGGEIMDVLTTPSESVIAPEVNSTPEAVRVQETDKNSKLIAEAEQLIKRGKYDGALDVYKSILKDEPMHLTALNGINKVINFYSERADYLKDNSNYQDALKYYYKVDELQPGSKKVQDNITLCLNQIKYNTAAGDSLAGSDSTVKFSSQLKP